MLNFGIIIDNFTSNKKIEIKKHKIQMKTIVKILVLFITTTLFANNIDKQVGEFSTVKVYDLIEVELVKGSENKIEITGENAEDVVIVNKNGILKIRMSLNKSFDGNNIKIKLFYTKLDVIDVNEGAKVFSKDVIKQYEIDLRAQEGASLNLAINVSYANIKSVTGGNIEVSGEATSQNVLIRTGGIYNGMDLNTEKTDVSISAGGEASVKASKLVDANVKAGGEIRVYGKPQTLNETTVLGGTVKRM